MSVAAGLIDWAEQGPQADLLRMALILAVPLWIDRHIDTGYDDETLIAHAQFIWNVKAARQHEALLYKVKAHKSGGERIPGTAEVFNWFAEAVACCAIVTAGGIDVLGLHFCPGDCERCTRGPA